MTIHIPVNPPIDGLPMPELISVTSDTVDAVFPELPRMVRLALGFGTKLQRGTLDVTLADGRMVRLGGNAFYSAWLDPSMTYSSGLFEDGTADLTAAQNNKYRRLAEAIDLKPGQKLLEIGCGWGGFAEYAAKTFGTKVVGLTISKEQRDFAQARIHKGGLSDKVEIRLQDYRDERDRYDRIASIEMIEAVGEQFWPKYFSQLRDLLLPGGLAGIQAITIQDSLFQTYRREVDFIQRYVFPGGMLPSPQILKTLGARFGVPVIRERIFGQDYARTLAIWRSNFRAAWPHLMPSGFDERFRRLWEYYLAYSEAGFLSGNIDVRQVVFAKSG